MAAEGPFLLDATAAAFATGSGILLLARISSGQGGGLAWQSVANGVAMIVMLGLLTGLTVYRRRVRAWVHRTLVRRDRAAYDGCWARLLASDAEVAALKRLSVLARRRRPGAGARMVRQSSAGWPSTPPRGASPAGSPRTGSPRRGLRAAWLWLAGGGRRPGAGGTSALGDDRATDRDCEGPATSLDDLYEQAARADRLLRDKARDLARAAGGEVVCEGGGDRFGLKGRKGGLKPAGRAVEKLVRSYGGDVSRLLDLCRCVRMDQSGVIQV
jgi:hypothetical protein